MIAVALGILAIISLLSSILVGRQNKAAPAGWNKFDADYDATVYVSGGEENFPRYSFWYTDIDGTRRCTAITLSLAVEFHLGQTVSIAVSPDRSSMVILDKIAFSTLKVSLACLGTGFAGLAIYCAFFR